MRYRFLPDYKHLKRSRFGKLALGHLLLCIFFSFLFFLFDSVEFSGIYTVYYVLNFSFRRQGQYNFAKVIKPLDNASNMVTVRFKDERKELFSDTGTRVISDDNLPR